MDKRLFSILGVFFLLAVTFVAVNAIANGKSQKPNLSEAANLARNVSNYVPTTKSDTAASVPVVKTVLSPDGKLEAKLSQLTGNSKNEWMLTVAGISLLQESLPLTTTLSIPENAFSPDNKYVFLKQDMGNIETYMIFKTNGDTFPEGLSSIEIASLFGQKEPGFNITEATGWAAPNLIVINTDKKEGGTGPSFWFDVNSEAFIRLSTRFN